MSIIKKNYLSRLLVGLFSIAFLGSINAQDTPIKKIDTDRNFTEDTLSNFVYSKGYFPMKSSLGVELSYNLEQSASNENNLEYGLNYLFTSAYNKNKAPSEAGFIANRIGIFQFGPTFSARRTNGEDTPSGFEGDFWVLNGGLLYNQMTTDFLGIGFTLRGKGVVYRGEGIQGDLFDNLDLKAEAGITFFSVLNVYYGRTFVINQSFSTREEKDHISISLVLNPSLLKFGLQGM